VSLELEPTPDILAELGEKRGNRLLVGFAAETENLREYARHKLEAKNCDMIVANQAQSAFDSDTNEVLLVLRSGGLIEIPRALKREIADSILSAVVTLRR
jgi:phosphopantothenoylcysteine decarboxylase/phosphopantothenate--cysteine ligase